MESKTCAVCAAEITAKTLCPDCARAKTKLRKAEYYQKNAERIRLRDAPRREAKIAYLKAYREKNLDKVRDANRAWYAKNRDSQLQKFKEYGAANKERAAEYLATHKEQRLRSRKAYNQAKKAVYAAHASKRRAITSAATPSWANIDRIKQIYIECERMTEETGIPHHVDHIVPLRSKWVCGLHVENNLQIITAAENVKKGNRVWPDSFISG